MKAPWLFIGILLLIVVGGVVSVVRARSKYGEVLNTRAQFEQLNTGDRIVYVCRQCDARQTVVIRSDDHAMDFCREGAQLSCPGCNDEMRVVLKQTTRAAGPAVEVHYVNKKGHECLTSARALPEP